MNNEWLFAGTRGANMNAKALTLPFKITTKTVIIKAGFANGDNARMCRKL
jgi:hypothetical protein